MYDIVKIIDYELRRKSCVMILIRSRCHTLTLLESSINTSISIMKLMIELHSDNHTIACADIMKYSVDSNRDLQRDRELDP